VSLCGVAHHFRPFRKRAEQAHYAANYDLRLLKAFFNHGIRHKVVADNPVNDIPFLPVEKKVKYVPPALEIDKIISLADPDTQDYLLLRFRKFPVMRIVGRLRFISIAFRQNRGNFRLSKSYQLRRLRTGDKLHAFIESPEVDIEHFPGESFFQERHKRFFAQG